jgi:hypothetical protein
MSNQITEAFVQAFADNYLHVAQQKESRLQGTVLVDGSIVGMSKSVNRLGKRQPRRRTSRHADTPVNDQPHSTRYIDLADWDDGDLVDDLDQVRLLVDPTSDYVQAMVAGFNRTKDQVIIEALGGNSRSTTGNVVLPSTQKIAQGGTGLTKAKIIQTKKMFRAAEADEENGEELYMLYSATGLSDVLSDATLTSADFLAGQMLQSGTLKGKWMGFTWIPTEQCPVSGTSPTATRKLYAYAKSGVKLGIGKDITTKVGEDPGKGFNTRVYAKMSIGAVRIEEEKVVEISVIE